MIAPKLVRILFPAFILFFALPAFAQKNITEVGRLTYQQNLSDIWGYTDSTGHEYALVTTEDGLSIVDISSDPSNPNELFFIQGSNTTWRDVKVWNDHAYVTNEGGGGLLIVDLSKLPNSINDTRFDWNNQFSTAHNIFIDEQGFAYIMGADFGVGGLLIFDLTQDPMNPVHAGTYNQRYVHDGFARNDTFWAAEIQDGIFSVLDISDRQNPAVMATHSTPSNFTHNLWLSNDGNTLFTTDEKPDAFIASYDVSQLNNISELDRYQSSPGQNVVVHNTFVKDGFLVTSYYRDGVVVNDASRPNNIVETGYFDTSPLSGDGFNGCWGVYPYLPSGLVLATDVQEGLFVLDVTYQNAAFLEGSVTDSANGAPLPNSNVRILANSTAKSTDLSGNYQTGIVDAGSYDVKFSKAGYFPKTISAVTLFQDSAVTLDVKLKRKPTFSFSGQVNEKGTNQGIQGVEVLFDDGQVTFKDTSDNNGLFLIQNAFSGQFDVFAEKWGYVTKKKANVSVQNGGNATIELERGIYDDFLFQNDWNVTTTASAGGWERAKPIGTSFFNEFVNPEKDVDDDFGEQCYVTGNGGGSVGDDDVDDGETVLSSPFFNLAAFYNDPYITFDYWFVNRGGNSQPNDSLSIYMFNGLDTVHVHSFGPQDSESQWSSFSFRVKDHVSLSANMQLFFNASDDPQEGHLVEAAIDHLVVVDSMPTSTDAPFDQASFAITLFPNPASSQLHIRLNRQSVHGKFEVFNIQGQKMYQSSQGASLSSQALDVSDWPAGVYFLKATVGQEQITRKFTVAQ